MNAKKLCLFAGIGLLAVALLFNTAQAQVTVVAGSNADSLFGSQNDSYQASAPVGLNPWPAVGVNPPAFYGTINQLPGVLSPPPGTLAPSNVTPFNPFNATGNFNDGFGNTASSAISGYVFGSSGTADDAQIGLFMALNQTSGGYAYEQINYDIDFNVSSVVNATGTAGTLPGIVSRSFSVGGSVGSSSAAFVAFGGYMQYWDATTNTALGAPLLFNYVNVAPGAFSATVSASSFINAVNFPDQMRITGNFFLIGDPSSITVNSVPVPEPSTFVLAALSVCGLVACARRKNVRR